MAGAESDIIAPITLGEVIVEEEEEVVVIEEEGVSYVTQVFNFLQAAAAQAWQKSMLLRMTVYITIITGIVDAISIALGGLGCVIREATIDHMIESFEAMGAVLMFFFVNPFDPTMFCFMWWIVYVILFIIWWLIRAILMAFGMEFIQDLIFCALRVVDDIDLTNGNLFLTKFPDKVICNCFTLPTLDALISFKFAHCDFPGLGDINNTLGPPAQLNQCYGPCGDNSNNCKYPISCTPIIVVSSPQI